MNVVTHDSQPYSTTLDNKIWLLKNNNDNNKTVLKRQNLDISLYDFYFMDIYLQLDPHKYSWSHQNRQKWLELIQALYK